MGRKAMAAAAVGSGLLLLAVPLGSGYAELYLRCIGGAETAAYWLAMEGATRSFQVLGGVLLALGGAAWLLQRLPARR